MKKMNKATDSSVRQSVRTSKKAASTMLDSSSLPTWKVLLRLLRLVHGLEGWMIIAIIAGVLGFLCALGIPVFGIMAAAATLPGPVHLTFTAAIVCMILFAILRGVLRYGEQACNHYIAFRLLAQIRDKVFGKLRTLGPAKLDGHQKGDLISLITSDVELLEVFYAHTISPACIALLSAIIYCIFGFLLHPSIGFMLLASYICTGVLIPAFFGSKAQKTGIARREANAELSSIVLENVHGIDEITQYHMQDDRRRKMETRTEKLLEKEEEQRRQTIHVSNAALASITLFSLAMTLLCAHLASAGAIYQSQALCMIVFQMSSFGPFMALANLSTGLSQTLGAARRVLALLDEKPLTPDIENGTSTIGKEMRVESLDFAYDKAPVLKNLSLQFGPNEIVGIEGKSGCGKSTLLRMLMRFYDPDSGRVFLNDTDQKTLRTDSLRASQSVVLQDTVLFTDTIRQNILLAKPDASEEELMAACRKANLQSLLDTLPNGLDTMLAEAGSSLSSGERQRIGLARAFLHDADLLLLDEPTSNLDSLNEGAILRAIATQTDGKTVILISHRKGTLSFADRILEMKPAASSS